MPEITGNNNRAYQRVEAIQSIAESSMALIEPVLTAQAEMLRAWADTVETMCAWNRRTLGSGDAERRYPSATE